MIVVRDLAALYRTGLRAPLPLPIKTSSEYANRRSRGDDPSDALIAADRQWKSGDRMPGEQADAAHALIHGTDAPITVLTAAAPWPGEAAPEEQHRFGVLARRLWQPLLDAEQMVRL